MPPPSCSRSCWLGVSWPARSRWTCSRSRPARGRRSVGSTWSPRSCRSCWRRCGSGMFIRRDPRAALGRLGFVRPTAGSWCSPGGRRDLLRVRQRMDALSQHRHAGRRAEGRGGQRAVVGQLIDPVALRPSPCRPASARRPSSAARMQPRLGILWTALVFAAVHTQYGLVAGRGRRARSRHRARGPPPDHQHNDNHHLPCRVQHSGGAWVSAVSGSDPLSVWRRRWCLPARRVLNRQGRQLSSCHIESGAEP